MSLSEWWFPVLVVILAGFVKGVLGMGLPTIGIGLMGLVMSPVQAATIMMVPTSVTNVWQLLMGPSLWRIIRRLWPLELGIVVGDWLGRGTMAHGDTALIRGCLGLVLITYSVIGLANRRIRVNPAHEWWMGPIAGLIAGLLTVATGVTSVPLVPYLTGLEGVERDDLVQSLGLSFGIAATGLIIDLLSSGVMTQRLLIISALAVLPAMAGMQFGTAVRSKISAGTFRRCLLIGMLALGVELARHFFV